VSGGCASLAQVREENRRCPGVMALTPATWKMDCTGCHDRSWNGHPSAPRSTMPLRCKGCPVLKLMPNYPVEKISHYANGAD
jgi:hypothetical protein